MNSSVTCDSATSVMSSLCLEISASSRSNGPSNTSRCTWNPEVAPGWPSASEPGGSSSPRSAVISAVVATARESAAAVVAAAVAGTAVVAVVAGHAAAVIGRVTAVEAGQPGPPSLGPAQRDDTAEHHYQDHQNDEGSHVYIPPDQLPGTCSVELKLSGASGGSSTPRSARSTGSGGPRDSGDPAMRRASTLVSPRASRSASSTAMASRTSRPRSVVIPYRSSARRACSSSNSSSAER